MSSLAKTIITTPIILGLFLLFTYETLAQRSSDPISNFNEFCEVFHQNYASFQEKNINWSGVCAEYSKRVSKQTTDEELFEIFSAMLKPLNDAHVSLKSKELDNAFSASRESTIMKELKDIQGKNRKPTFNQMIQSTLESYKFGPIKTLGPKFRDEQLFAYSHNETTGYLRFYRSFSTLAIMKGSSLQKQLSMIFENFYDKEAVIIDVRFNIGGDDKFSQTVMGMLVDQPTIGFYKQTRSNGEFGKMIPKMIEPGTSKAYKGKIILLTNDRTVSAADVLALMCSTHPRAIIIGERSNGSYSDLYHKKLPNGWKVTLSNQRYLSSDQKNYEGVGTPVNILTKNTREGIDQKRDDVLISAMEHLSTKTE